MCLHAVQRHAATLAYPYSSVEAATRRHKVPVLQHLQVAVMALLGAAAGADSTATPLTHLADTSSALLGNQNQAIKGKEPSE